MQQRIGNPFAGRKDPQHLSPDLALHRLIDALHAHREALRVWTDPYEPSAPVTIGGPTVANGPTYAVVSPFDSPAEFTVVQVSFVGTGPFSAMLGIGIASPILPTATNSFNDMAGRNQVPYSSNVAGNIPQNDNWYPIGAYQQIAWAVGNGGAGFVTLQFRRRVNPAGIYSE